MSMIFSLVDILDCLRMSERTFYQALNLWNNTGDVVQHTFGIYGCPRILHFDDVDYLKWLVKAHPDWFLDERLFFLETNWFISAHYTTIHQELVCANVSTIKVEDNSLGEKWKPMSQLYTYNAWLSIHPSN